MPIWRRHEPSLVGHGHAIRFTVLLAWKQSWNERKNESVSRWLISKFIFTLGNQILKYSDSGVVVQYQFIKVQDRHRQWYHSASTFGKYCSSCAPIGQPNYGVLCAPLFQHFASLHFTLYYMAGVLLCEPSASLSLFATQNGFEPLLMIAIKWAVQINNTSCTVMMMIIIL